MNEVKRIMVRVTPTSNCTNVVEYAINLGARLGASVLVLDVVHDPFGGSGWSLPIPSLSEEYQRVLSDTRSRLEDLVRREQERGFHMESLVREGDPVEEITRVIKEKGIDILVLPAHTEDRVEHLLFGGVNEKLMRTLPCSILFAKIEDGDLC